MPRRWTFEISKIVPSPKYPPRRAGYVPRLRKQNSSHITNPYLVPGTLYNPLPYRRIPPKQSHAYHKLVRLVGGQVAFEQTFSLERSSLIKSIGLEGYQYISEILSKYQQGN